MSMTSSVEHLLKSLEPATHARIYDLVGQAGIDITPWGKKKNGDVVKEPQTNQAYVSNWAFGGGKEPIALCVWHEHLVGLDGHISYKGNLDEYARGLEYILNDRFASKSEKQSAQIRAGRAWHFGKLVQEAKYKDVPVRLILLRQKSGSVDESEDSVAKADFRFLDEAEWFVHERASDGAFRIVRGIRPQAPSENDEPTPNPLYADQFSIPEASEKVHTSGGAYSRSAEVRAKVLARAKGVCEYCGSTGFKMANGAIYLETHHVFPLSKRGPDIEWNVLAICPDDHRRAHYAHDRDQMRAEMVAKLILLEPLAQDALSTLAGNFLEMDTDD